MFTSTVMLPTKLTNLKYGAIKLYNCSPVSLDIVVMTVHEKERKENSIIVSSMMAYHACTYPVWYVTPMQHVRMFTVLSCCSNVHCTVMLFECSLYCHVVQMFTVLSCCSNVHCTVMLFKCSLYCHVVQMFTVLSCSNVHCTVMLPPN